RNAGREELKHSRYCLNALKASYRDYFLGRRCHQHRCPTRTHREARRVGENDRKRFLRLLQTWSHVSHRSLIKLKSSAASDSQARLAAGQYHGGHIHRGKLAPAFPIAVANPFRLRVNGQCEPLLAPAPALQPAQIARKVARLLHPQTRSS